MKISRAILFFSLAAAPTLTFANLNQPATFTDSKVICDDPIVMNLDGSIECRAPFFQATMTNGVTTTNVDGSFRANLSSAALQAQGQGICALIGYPQYICSHAHSISNDPSRDAYAPFVTLDKDGIVVNFRNSGWQILDSVKCK